MNHQSRTAVRIPPWLVGGNVFYLLSAVCIMLGVAQIVVPLYQQLDPQPGASLERFYCLLALNAYELALMAVVLVILLWKNVTDDAIGLTLLISVFLIGSAVALDTIAPDLPGATLCFGIGGLFLACGKLFALEQYITGNWRRWMLLWIMPLLAWNFLMPSALGYAQSFNLLKSELAKVWVVGSHLVLLGALGLWISMLINSTGSEINQDRRIPFLHRPLMRWIIVFAILTATLAHQWALIWSLNLPLQLGDLLPTFGLIAFILIELMRLYRKQDVRIDLGIGLAIPAVAYGVVFTNSYSPLDAFYAFHAYPPGFLLLTAGLFLIKAILPWIQRKKQTGRQWVHANLALALASAGALIVGIEPGAPIDFQIAAAATILTIGLSMMAWARRSWHQLNLAAFILILGLSIDPPASMTSPDWSVWTRIGIAAFTYGLLCLPIHLFAARRFDWGHTLVNTIALTAGTILCFVLPDTLVWDTPLWMPVIIVSAVALFSWQSKYWLNPLVALLALLTGIYQQFQDSPGWLLIVTSFVILAIGAAASIAKAGPSNPANPDFPDIPGPSDDVLEAPDFDQEWSPGAGTDPS